MCFNSAHSYDASAEVRLAIFAESFMVFVKINQEKKSHKNSP